MALFCMLASDYQPCKSNQKKKKRRKKRQPTTKIGQNNKPLFGIDFAPIALRIFGNAYGKPKRIECNKLTSTCSYRSFITGVCCCCCCYFLFILNFHWSLSGIKCMCVFVFKLMLVPHPYHFVSFINDVDYWILIQFMPVIQFQVRYSII